MSSSWGGSGAPTAVVEALWASSPWGGGSLASAGARGAGPGGELPAAELRRDVTAQAPHTFMLQSYLSAVI